MKKTNEDAKKIYFENFGNYMIMRKNGEYQQYLKYRIPIQQEEKWTKEIRLLLVEEIINGDYLRIYALTRMNISEEELQQSIKQIFDTPVKENVYRSVLTLKGLIDDEKFALIKRIFEENK